MVEIINPHIKLKEKFSQNDYEDINNLQKLCLQRDKTTLKLELDYKLRRAEDKKENINSLNEFMYYNDNLLIGYIGICHYGGKAIEVNGMVHPEFRRRGIFRKLYSLVKDEWVKRQSQEMLLLSDNNSIPGLEFIKCTEANYKNSEYEMFLRDFSKKNIELHNVILRKATNHDVQEIAKQNSIYSDFEYNEEDIVLPEEEEKHGSMILIAEFNHNIIGKVHLELSNGIGGIYGFGVLPEYRRKGFGRQILTRAIEILVEKDSKEIMLQVLAKNKKALDLYKSCGFEVTSTMDYYEINKK